MRGRNQQTEVLIIHHSGYFGGAGISLIHIIECLKSIGCKIVVCCPFKPSNMRDIIENMGIECIELPSSIEIYRHYAGSDKFFLDPRSLTNFFTLRFHQKEFAKVLIHNSSEVVMINTMTLAYLGKIVKKNNRRAICFNRETYSKGTFGFRSRIIKKQLSEYFDKVVFISRYDEKKTGKISSRGYVVTDKVILGEYSNYASNVVLDKNNFNVLYTGGMEKLKGAHVIIEALRYCDKRVHLVFMQFDQPKRTKSIKDCFTIKSKIRFILGLDYGANTLKLIEKYNLWNQIDFFPLTYNMDTFYVESNVVVFPSTIAHQARPIFESGAAKKPIIITRSENIAEFVEENKSGLLFRNNNSLELAKLIMRLFKDPDLCRKLGERNYELACQYHNFESMKSELMEILEI